MLPSNERLKRPHLFTRAYGARKLVTTPIFTLHVLPRQATGRMQSAPTKPLLPMVGFVVSKKTAKSAFCRNRMKRRLREAYRSLSPGQSLNKWYTMVFVIKENALTATWAE